MAMEEERTEALVMSDEDYFELLAIRYEMMREIGLLEESLGHINRVITAYEDAEAVTPF